MRKKWNILQRLLPLLLTFGILLFVSVFLVDNHIGIQVQDNAGFTLNGERHCPELGYQYDYLREKR